MSAGPRRVKGHDPAALGQLAAAGAAARATGRGHRARGRRRAERLLGSIRAHRLPLVVVTGPSDRARWSPALAGLDVRAVRLRPVFIGDVTRAARAALRADD